MGTCQCEKKNSSNEGELNNFFTRNHNSTHNNTIHNQNHSGIKINIIPTRIQDDPNQDKEQDINENETKRQKLKEITNFINARIINNFISKNLNRMYNKDKYNKLITQTKKIFLENEEISFIYGQSYFKQIFDSKLSKFLNNKDIIIKDLFSEKFRKNLYSFPKLKELLNTEHNDYIVIHHKSFADELLLYGLNNNIIKKEMTEGNNINRQVSNLITIKKNELVNINKNFTIRKKKNSILVKKDKNSIKNIVTKDDKVNRKFKASITKNYTVKKREENFEEIKNNSFEKDKNNIEAHFNLPPVQEKISAENIIKKELDKFYDICFGSKITFSEFEKTSIFFKLMTSEEQDKVDALEINNLIKCFYYIFLLKKYNYLSDTNKSFFKIKPILIKKTSLITNKLMLQRKEYISKQENILKMKILKGLFNNNANSESDLSESFSSVLSEEDKKEYYSLISPNKESPLLKKLSKEENDKSNNSNNKRGIYKIEEEISEDVKSEQNLSIHNSNIEKVDLKEKDKNSFQRKNSIIGNSFKIKRKKSGNIYRNPVFSEYYNGQYDNTVFLYAGLGTLVNHNKKKLYHGTFRYGKKEGLGIMYQIKKENAMDYFMGEFHQNKIKGFGIKISIKDTELIHQEGIFDEDKLIKGKYKKIIIKKDSNTIITISYKGDLENQKLSGHGKLIEKMYKYDIKINSYELYQVVDYTGDFFNDQKNGKGKEILRNSKYSNKNYKYEGNFINGVKDGYGIIIYEKSNFVNKYEGFFVNDKPFQIYGKINFKSGDIYEGFFENNLKDNVGLYLFIDSKSKKCIEEYFGGFLEDYKDGIGRTVVEESGGAKMLRGVYKKGDKEGQFEKIVFKNDNLNKKRRYGKTEETFLDNEVKEKRGERLPKIQIKTFPIYEENEIIDVNDNYIYDLNH